MDFDKKYKIVSQLVSDKNVFRATNNNDEEVFIKIEKTENEISFLRHEAEIYSKLKGIPSVLALKWFGCHKDSFCYLVLPFVSNSLQDVIQSQSLNASTSKQIGQQLLGALESIHSRDIIHRDIKPDNVLIDQTGQIYIIDFGMSKRFRQGGEHIPQTSTHDIIGTFDYISLNVHQKVSPSRRDDVISVGYIMMQLYSQTLPWQGDAKNCIRLKHTCLTQLIGDPFLKRVQQFLQGCQGLNYCETPNYVF